MTRSPYRRTSAIWMRNMAGYQAERWIPSPHPSKLPRRSALARGVSVPWAKMPVYFAPSSVGDSRCGNYRKDLHGMEKNTMNGESECAWDLMRRERNPNGFVTCTPPLRGFAKRAFGKLWK